MSETFGFRSQKKVCVEAPKEPPTTLTSKDSTRTWSPQQQAIFEFCSKSKKSLVVRARAGTGKTTTILAMLPHLKGKTLLCAFNKRIADELSERVPYETGAHVRTLHSLGFYLLKRKWPAPIVDQDRSIRLARAAMQTTCRGLSGWDNDRAVAKLSDLLKETAPRIEDPDEVLPVAELFGVFDHCRLAPGDDTLLARAAIQAMKLAQEPDGTVGFSDMIYLPLIFDIVRGEYDNVIVDEAQDMNFAQLELAQRACRSRLIVVGDDRQAIYGFRGAASGSIDRLKKAYAADELGLTVTYRCPKLVVQEAQKYVKDFVAAESAPVGTVTQGSREKTIEAAQPGDFVLSRTNAPLVSVCLELVRRGRRARIEGKDIGKGLIGLVRKARTENIEEMLTWLGEWEYKAIKRAHEDEKRVEMIQDQVAAITVLAEEASDVSALCATIDTLFADTGNRGDSIVLSTIHKAKGLEANRVFILCDTFRGGWATLPVGEESNLRYVAVTRAKQELILVDPHVTPPAHTRSP